MVQKEIIDRVRLIIGDTERVLIPDDMRVRALSNIAFQRVYRDLGVSFKDVLDEVVTGEEPEVLLPEEFLKPKVVLVNGIASAEVSYERAVSGYAFGVNQSGDYNGVIQTSFLPQRVYYFRNTPQGRYLGVSPIGHGETARVFCVFDSVPMVQESGSSYSEMIPSMYSDILVYGTVLEVLPEIESFSAAEKRALSQKSYQVEMLRLMPNTEARMQILLPLQIQTELKRHAAMLKVEYTSKYESELKRVRRLIQPTSKLPPKRYRQGLLDINTRSSRFF